MVRLFIFKSARWGQLLRIIDKGIRRPQQVVVHVFCVVFSAILSWKPKPTLSSILIAHCRCRDVGWNRNSSKNTIIKEIRLAHCFTVNCYRKILFEPVTINYFQLMTTIILFKFSCKTSRSSKKNFVVYSKSCNLKKTIAQTLLNAYHWLQFVLLLFVVDEFVKTIRKQLAYIHPIVHLPQDSMQNYWWFKWLYLDL